MKLLSIIFFSAVLLFTGGCSSTVSQTAPQTPLPTESNEVVKKQSLVSFDDGTITCKYDDVQLNQTSIGSSSTFSYGTIFYDSTADPTESVTDGSSVYTAQMNFDSAELFYTSPTELTQAFFDGIFNASEGNAEIITNSDGTCEYFVTQPDYACKGKIFGAQNGSISFVVYRVSSAASSKLTNAFDECYNSLAFSSAFNPPASQADSTFDTLLDAAEESAANSSKIEDGVLFDSITSVYPNVSLTDIGDAISVNIYIEHLTYDDDAAAFYLIIKSICESCSLEDAYSGVNFFLFIDDSPVASLTFTDYSSPLSFKSAAPIVFDDNIKDSLDKYYDSLYASNDINQIFDASLDALYEKYNISK